MISSYARRVLAVALSAAAAGACGGATRSSAQAPPPQPVAAAAVDSARPRHTAADARFMSAMIGHHAQAILMAGWAETHGASPEIRRLAARIVNGQRDEIATAQQWLRDRGLPAPEPGPGGMRMTAGGTGHEHHAPGMLTEEQLSQLDQARGKEFDRLFLQFMIQHHRGAVEMVKELLGSQGAAQDETVFKFASDVNVDQTTEIERMQKMLVELLFEPRTP